MTNWSPILKSLAPNAPVAIFNPLVAAIPEAFSARNIDTPYRQAHFLAQMLYETTYLKHLIENLNYSAERIETIFKKLSPRSAELEHNPVALANAAYANRYGNGDEASGDGWRFRGRGFFQHTFRNNYKELSKPTGIDLETSPDRLIEGPLALKAALHYFTSRGCLPLADKDDIVGVTKRINGGDNGLAERTQLKNRLLKLLGGDNLASTKKENTGDAKPA